MTRINLVDPTELADQHLFAEYREIKMVPKALKRSLRTKSPASIKQSIPGDFRLGKGHVTFFFDKMTYLSNRYNTLVSELKRRGVNAAYPDFKEYTVGLDKSYFNDYTPTKDALSIIRSRIAEKIAMKPEWYRWTK